MGIVRVEELANIAWRLLKRRFFFFVLIIMLDSQKGNVIFNVIHSLPLLGHTQPFRIEQIILFSGSDDGLLVRLKLLKIYPSPLSLFPPLLLLRSVTLLFLFDIKI